MKLSFVIPAYNEEAYIGKCLDSIARALATSPCDAEIIVVNNASTDRTAEVLSRYGGSIRVVNEPRKGLMWARKAGFLASTGDLIAHIDADTMVPDQWIPTVMSSFARDQNLIALSGPFILYDLPKKRFAIMAKVFYIATFISYIVSKYILNIGSVLQGGNYIVRRSILEKVDAYNTDIELLGEDADMARRLHPHGHVKFTFKLPIYASGRRVAAEGAFTMAIQYGINYIWVLLFKKPFTRASAAIRPVAQAHALAYAPKNKIKEWGIGAAVIMSAVAVMALVGYASLDVVGTYVAPTKVAHVKIRARALAAKVDTFFDFDKDVSAGR